MYAKKLIVLYLLSLTPSGTVADTHYVLVSSFTTLGVLDSEHREHERWFPFWAFTVSGPVLYVVAFIHLLTGLWYIGVFVSSQSYSYA